MSEQARLSDLPMFADLAPPAPVARVLEDVELVHGRYLRKLRAALRAEAQQHGVPMTADDAHRLMRTRPGLSMPADMNPNALGGLFRGDKDEQGRCRWTMGDFVKSTRDGADGNPIRAWRLRQ